MASFFLSETNSDLPEPSRPKRPRSSLACIRCRKKKVKCDFVQPTCNRCSAAGLQCSYATPPRRVDGHAFDQLGRHVQELKDRMQRIQAELALMKRSPQNPPSVVTSTQVATPQQQPMAWKLPVSPSGYCIDTTSLASVAELYHTLLDNISEVNNTHAAITPANKHTPKINECEPGMQQLLPKPHLDHLMHTCYHSCFIPHQVIDTEAFTRLYTNDALDPLLTSSINAWMVKHGCTFHSIPPHGDAVALCEGHYATARETLKRNFDTHSHTAIQALLHLYMYQLSSERSDLAYLCIGLAMRMAQDLNLHRKTCMPPDKRQSEANKRLWWSTYWLNLCASLELNRPTMVDDKECDIDFPSVLETEDEETNHRLAFCVQSIQLMRIRKDITQQLPTVESKQSLLSAIARFEHALSNWFNELPQVFQLSTATERGQSFRHDAMLILHIQYHATWILLHRPMLPKENPLASPVAQLSLNHCSKAANAITRLLSTQWVKWCQFIFVLEDALSSIPIHQLNAVSTETNIACLAQRNLLLTADILANSPMMHMHKIKQHVGHIKIFLKTHDLPLDLSQVRSASENAASSQPSISCAMHLDALESDPKRRMSASLVTHHPNATEYTAMEDPSVLYDTLIDFTGSMDDALLMFGSSSAGDETFTQGMFTQSMAPAQFVAVNNNNNNNNNNNMYPGGVFGAPPAGYPAHSAAQFQADMLEAWPSDAGGSNAEFEADYAFLASRKRMHEWGGSG